MDVVLAAHGDGILATDLRSGALLCSYEEGGPVQAFGCVDAAAEHVYAVQASKALWQVWPWNTKKPSFRASLPEKITAMAFSQDATLCFAGAASGTIYVWLASTGSLLRYWPAHFREVTQLLVAEGFLISAGADAAVQVYNLAEVFAESGQVKGFQNWAGHSLSVTSLALLGQTVATAGLDRTVRLWDLQTGQGLQSRSLPAQVHGLSCSPGELVACGAHGELRGMDVRDLNQGGAYVGHSTTVLSCASSLDGSRLASCSEVERVRVWETRTRQCVTQLHATRDVKITGVKIVRQLPLPGTPPFQPFQRLLSEELPSVWRALGGREVQLRRRMEPYTRAEGILEHVQWAGAASKAEAKLKDEPLQLEELRASQQRWAQVASQLYSLVVEKGLDSSQVP